MDAGSGDETAVVLLRALPVDVAELILSRLVPQQADRLRARLATPAQPTSEPDLAAALAAFFDLKRIMERQAQMAPAAASPQTSPEPQGRALELLRDIPPEQLARALASEPPAAVALVLSALEPAVAGQALKRLPAALQADVAARLTRPAARNPALLDRLARAVLDKAGRLADVPPDPTPEERINRLADMLRVLPRQDRKTVLAKIQATDPDVYDLIQAQLYRIEDLLRIPDRQLQALLGELDLKKVSLALQGVDEAVRNKVLANMSTRARSALAEESEMLKSIPVSVIRTARLEVLALVRKHEDDGKIVLDE